MRTPLPASCAAAWRVPPRALRLSNDEVHVWCAALDQTPSQINSFLRTLAADERARAERFHFPRDREHFIVARGTLRAILGFYLNRAPQCLSFRYSSHGKPALTLESGEDPIRFNISHSHGVALYAITCDREVGIDLEWVRSNLEVEQIAERFFSRQESRHFVRSQRPFADTHSFCVGLARKPISRLEAKGFHCRWTSSMCRLLPGNPLRCFAPGQIQTKLSVGL